MLSLLFAVLLIVICVANMVDIANVIANVIDTEHAAAGHALAEPGTGTQFGVGIIIVFVGGLVAVVGLLLTLFGARARSIP